MIVGPPQDPEACVVCLRDETRVCADHRGPDGKPSKYVGPDRWEPQPHHSRFLHSITGKKFRSGDGQVYKVRGYDPRYGFIIEDEKDPSNVRDISERSIGRTFHLIEGT